jgi:EPS-associated MarR family transcriptional regulator
LSFYTTQNGGSVPKYLAQTFPMTSRQSQLQEDTYYRVMRLIESNPDLTQRELAGKLGVSVGGLNYCLKALIQKGFVKMHNFGQSKNKFGYVYLLTPAGVVEKSALTGRFLQRKLREYESLKSEIQALAAEASDGAKRADDLRLADE